MIQEDRCARATVVNPSAIFLLLPFNHATTFEKSCVSEIVKENIERKRIIMKELNWNSFYLSF